MKRLRLFFVLPLLLVGVTAFAQVEMPSPRAVEKAYRSEYRNALRAEERNIENLLEEGWEIIIPIEERVPTSVIPAGFGVQTIDHWGKGILLPESLISRILAECNDPVVAKISDTGVDEKHPELAGNWWLPESDYTGDGPELHIHGTHVAGIAFSLLEPLIRGGKVTLKDCRNLGSEGQGNFSWAANMIATERTQDLEYIAKSVPVIYNFSWGGMRGIEPTLEEQLKISSEKGVIFVAAAGNNGPGEAPSYPASSAYVIATASLDRSLTVSSFSTRGSFVDNAMPGRDINSTAPGGGFAVLSGTSMSSPMLFAATIIAKSKWGNKIPDGAAMQTYLSKVATDIDPAGYDKAAGFGIAYFYAILDNDPEKVIGTPPPPPPPVVLKKYTSEWESFVIRWRMNTAANWNVIQIPAIRITVNGETPTEASFDKFDKFLPTYFQNRGIILTGNMTSVDAMFWAGKFLEFVAKQNGFEAYVEEMTAIDEQGRKFIFNNFKGNLNQLVESYGGKGPTLIVIEE